MSSFHAITDTEIAEAAADAKAAGLTLTVDTDGLTLTERSAHIVSVILHETDNDQVLNEGAARRNRNSMARITRTIAEFTQ